MTSISVFGVGAWGTALAKLLAENSLAGSHYKVMQWGRRGEDFDSMLQHHRNNRYLPDVVLPNNLILTADIEQALATDMALVVIPSQGFRGFIEQYCAEIQKIGHLVWATKGLEPQTCLPLDRVASQVLGSKLKLAVISGPNFAVEVARQVPTATTVASSDLGFAQQVVNILHNDWFRAYTSTDMTGVQLGGALKNALAIASGIADGLGFGANTRAALLTRGMAEISRLAVVMGAKAETMTGLAGIGDLILTCTDNKSRNRRFGLLLAEGKSADEAVQQIGQVVEGIKTSAVAHRLAQDHSVEMPIIEQIYRVLYEGVPPKQAVQSLLSRERRAEH